MSLYFNLFVAQLEDDVVTKPGYLSTIKNFATHQVSTEWILLEFSTLGFIGKLLCMLCVNCHRPSVWGRGAELRDLTCALVSFILALWGDHMH